MTSFQLRLKGIIDGTYTIPQCEINLENKLWERWIDINEEKLANKEESLKRLKEYNREYHREYYRRKLAKGKWTADREYTPRTEASALRSQNRRQYDYRNKLCIYNGETVKFGTLIHRFFKVYGDWTEATIKAKLYLVK